MSPNFFSIFSQELQGSLNSQEITSPTPIQQKVIPILCNTSSPVLALASTGSGKTLAYTLPLIHRVSQDRGFKALIVLPTRDLAFQVYKVFNKYHNSLNFNSSLLCGGRSIKRDNLELSKTPNFIIGTPGRLIYHWEFLKNYPIHTVVLDEVDRLLDIGFKKEIGLLLKCYPSSRMILFSATMPKNFQEITFNKNLLQNLVKVDLTEIGHQNPRIEERFVELPEVTEKYETLLKNLDSNNSTVVFVNTKNSTRILSRKLASSNLKVFPYSSDLNPGTKKRTIAQFSNLKSRGEGGVLIATDIAARGIDFKKLDLVINYDVPLRPTDYIHRIGRTGRADNLGKALTLVAPYEKKFVENIKRFKETNEQVVLPLKPILLKKGGRAFKTRFLKKDPKRSYRKPPR